MVEILYWYTIVAAGGFGLAMVVMPVNVRSLFGWPTQNPIVYGVTGSVWLAYGLLHVVIMAFYIIGDPITISLSHMFS